MLTRQFRWLLIRNGLSEDEADRAIEELRREFANATVSDAEQFQQLCEAIAKRLITEKFVHKKPGKLRPIGSRLLAFVVGIGTGIVANKLTPFVPDLVSERPAPPTLICPIRSPEKVGRRGDFGIRYQNELWIVAKHARMIVQAATSGFATVLPTTQWFVETRVKHSAEWETGYCFHGQQKRRLNFVQQGGTLGIFGSEGRTLVFTLFYEGASVDPLPYFPELRSLEERSSTWKMTPDEARMVLGIRSAGN
jgi:hypothetical protein